MFNEDGYIFCIEKGSSRNFVGVHQRHFPQLCQNLDFLPRSYLLDSFFYALDQNGRSLKCTQHIQIKCVLVYMHNGENFSISSKLNRAQKHFHHWIYHGSVLQVI